MCGRYTQTVDIRKLAKAFGVASEHLPDVKPQYNVAPSQEVPVVVKKRGNERALGLFHWGLVPVWAKDPGIGNKMINARSETLAEKPSFRGPFKNSRCLVLADGFYEWKREGKYKVPHYIRLKSRAPFGFAGLWSHWTGGDGGEILSCTIITCEPNQLMKPIHHRMPVILPEERHSDWLSPDLFDTKKLSGFLKSFDTEKMEAFPVSKLVNSPANNTPDCIKTALLNP
jgi:putative SOS response-associated peptidase YedK